MFLMVGQDDEVLVGVSGTRWREVDIVRGWRMQEILALGRRAVGQDREPGLQMTGNTGVSQWVKDYTHT